MPIEQHPLIRRVRTVNSVGIFKCLDVQIKDDHGVDIADLVGLGKWKDGERLLFPSAEQQKLTGCAVMGVDGKVYSVGKSHGSVYIKEPGPHGETGDFSMGVKKWGDPEGIFVCKVSRSSSCLLMADK